MHKSIDDLQGSWSTRIIQSEGRVIPFELIQRFSAIRLAHPLIQPTFRRDEWIDVSADGKQMAALCKVRLEPSNGVKAVDLITQRGVVHAIYRQEGNMLLLCLNVDQAENRRPTDFFVTAGMPRISLVCERVVLPEAAALGGLRQMPAPQPVGSLPEVSAATLRSVDEAKIADLESIYARQLKMCNDLSGISNIGRNVVLGMERNLALGAIGRFDRWCGRDQKTAFAALIKSSVREVDTQFQKQSELYEAAAQTLRKQLDIIHERQEKAVR